VQIVTVSGSAAAAAAAASSSSSSFLFVLAWSLQGFGLPRGLARRPVTLLCR